MVFNRFACLLVLALLSIGCTAEKPPLTAAEIASQQVASEGSALIGSGGVEQARRAAIEAATANAAQQIKRNNKASMLISDIKVVDEWQQAGVYHVQVLAALSDKQLCASAYRKKIVATAFPLTNSAHLAGIESQDIFGGIPREIGNRLMESGDFISHNQTNTSLYTRPDLAPEVMPRTDASGAGILSVARQSNAQFVLSGVIRDFRIESAEYVRGSGFLAGLKWALRDLVGRRSIGIDVYVHDGLTGALLFQHRYTDSIVGDVGLPSGYTVGSERFESTPAGHAISQIIHEASDDIHKQLGCFPFVTRISQVQGGQVEISAGAQERIKRGDRLKIYSTSSRNHGLSAIASEPLGILTITDVNAASAIGSLEGGNPYSIKPGDWVKSENAF